MNTDKLTKQVISKMLKENTGIHFLDSGSAYGRHWQNNQVRQFDNEPESSLSFQYDYIEYSRNVYHFLCNALEYNKGLTNSLNHFESKRDDYESWYDTIQAWIDCKGYKIIHSDNTYNSQNNISQDFLYYLVSTDQNASDLYDTEFVILMIHGGCDIRGGYTSPKIFNCDIDQLLFYSDGSIFCENGHNWYTDDAYNWYSDNRDNDTKLNDFNMVDLDDFKSDLEDNPDWIESIQDEMSVDLTRQGLLFSNLPDWTDYKPDKIHPVKLPLTHDTIYHDDKIGYCPLCANNGILTPLLPG
jgi:hypothetical protein